MDIVYAPQFFERCECGFPGTVTRGQPLDLENVVQCQADSGYVLVGRRGLVQPAEYDKDVAIDCGRGFDDFFDARM